MARTKKKMNKEFKKESLTFRLRPVMKNKLEIAAANEQMTVSEFVRKVIEEFLTKLP
ncbi:hypothetical protein [Peromfec virus RodF8_36]|uniref:Uncharacterized protein n=1 Tax=Peromfec virus RodF8_36 TaxID=2929371 RepID=A0A976N040_9VIRU|nr:hypothetical protein [Peromfec virus RodF8_36]